jgi:hypothetical protein
VLYPSAAKIRVFIAQSSFPLDTTTPVRLLGS